MAEFTYVGYGTRGYAEYVDVNTGKMLLAEQGGTYEMRPTWQDLPVPPADGLWTEAAKKKAAPKAKSDDQKTDDTTKAGE